MFLNFCKYCYRSSIKINKNKTLLSLLKKRDILFSSRQDKQVIFYPILFYYIRKKKKKENKKTGRNKGLDVG